jgi:hypothetical protein
MRAMAGTARLRVRRCEVEDPATGARLEAVCVSAGADLVVTVGGGERPHVGAAALALSLPRLKDPSRLTESSSLLAVPGHKEEDLARDGARRLARALARSVVVTVGIHDDRISRARIAAYVALFGRLVDAIAAAHAAAPGGAGLRRRATARRRPSPR